MKTPKVYELDSWVFVYPIKKGATTIEVVTYCEHQEILNKQTLYFGRVLNRKLKEQAKEIFDEIERGSWCYGEYIIKESRMEKIKKKFIRDEKE